MASVSPETANLKIGDPYPGRPGFVVGGDLRYGITAVPATQDRRLSPDAPGGANRPISYKEAVERYGSDAGVNVSGNPTTPYVEGHDSKQIPTTPEDLAFDLRNRGGSPSVQQFARENPALAIQAQEINKRRAPVEVEVNNPRQFGLEKGGKYETTDSQGRRITLQGGVAGQLNLEGTRAPVEGVTSRLSDLGLIVRPESPTVAPAKPVRGTRETYVGLEGVTPLSNLFNLKPVASAAPKYGVLYSPLGKGYLYTGGFQPSVSVKRNSEPSEKPMVPPVSKENRSGTFTEQAGLITRRAQDKLALSVGSLLGANRATGPVGATLRSQINFASQMTAGAVVGIPATVLGTALDIGVIAKTKTEAVAQSFENKELPTGGDILGSNPFGASFFYARENPVQTAVTAAYVGFEPLAQGFSAFAGGVAKTVSPAATRAIGEAIEPAVTYASKFVPALRAGSVGVVSAAFAPPGEQSRAFATGLGQGIAGEAISAGLKAKAESTVGVKTRVTALEVNLRGEGVEPGVVRGELSAQARGTGAFGVSMGAEAGGRVLIEQLPSEGSRRFFVSSQGGVLSYQTGGKFGAGLEGKSYTPFFSSGLVSEVTPKDYVSVTQSTAFSNRGGVVGSNSLGMNDLNQFNRFKAARSVTFGVGQVESAVQVTADLRGLNPNFAPRRAVTLDVAFAREARSPRTGLPVRVEQGAFAMDYGVETYPVKSVLSAGSPVSLDVAEFSGVERTFTKDTKSTRTTYVKPFNRITEYNPAGPSRVELGVRAGVEVSPAKPLETTVRGRVTQQIGTVPVDGGSVGKSNSQPLFFESPLPSPSTPTQSVVLTKQELRAVGAKTAAGVQAGLTQAIVEKQGERAGQIARGAWGSILSTTLSGKQVELPKTTPKPVQPQPLDTGQQPRVLNAVGITPFGGTTSRTVVDTVESQTSLRSSDLIVDTATSTSSRYYPALGLRPFQPATQGTSARVVQAQVQTRVFQSQTKTRQATITRIQYPPAIPEEPLPKGGGFPVLGFVIHKQEPVFGRERKVKGTDTRNYTPSLFALNANIRTNKPPSVGSGLELRPIYKRKR